MPASTLCTSSVLQLTCVAGVLYASCAEPAASGTQRLQKAIDQLLQSVDEPTIPQVLWSLGYQRRVPASSFSAMQRTGPVITLQPLTHDLAMEDAVLEGVKTAWEQITGSDGDEYMKFEAREGQEDEES